MSATRDSLTRKREHVETLLGELKEHGSVKASDPNSIIADGEAGWEMGEFDDTGESKPFEERRDGFIIRTRRDALTTVLNTSEPTFQNRAKAGTH